MEDDLFGRLAEHIQRLKQYDKYNRRCLGWSHKDIFRTKQGAKQIVISFEKNYYDMTEEEICTHYLYCYVVKIEQEKLLDLIMNICMTGKFSIVYQEELDEGFLTDAEIDEDTASLVTETARNILYERTVGQRQSIIKAYVEEVREGVRLVVGNSTADSIVSKWLS